MLDFLIDDIFACRTCFLTNNRHPHENQMRPPSCRLVFYSCEADVMQTFHEQYPLTLLSAIKMMLSHYIIQNLVTILNIELEDASDTNKSASYLDLHLEIHNEGG